MYTRDKALHYPACVTNDVALMTLDKLTFWWLGAYFTTTINISSANLSLYYMATVLITGGTGLIGQALTKILLAQGYHVIILTRNAAGKKATQNLSFAQWDVAAQTIDSTAMQQADYIIHLAGAGVAERRWTTKRKQEIVDSRVQSSALILKTLRETDNKVRAVISASAIGWYGADPTIPNPSAFTETDNAAADFLGTTCVQWEQSIQPLTELNKRLVIFRTGIVLSNKGGAYAEFKKPLRFGVASVLGSGKQIISWIHIDDLVNLYIAAIENKTWQGVYNAVAPHPVSNKTLIQTIAKQRGGFYITAPVPAIALKGALGEMSIEVLKSTTVSSRKIEQAGYTFSFPHIEAAVQDLQKNAS